MKKLRNLKENRFSRICTLSIALFLLSATTLFATGGTNKHKDDVDRKDCLDLSVPNIGLKDPADITWPYGNEFAYDTYHREEYVGPTGTTKTTNASQYKADENGGILMEPYETWNIIEYRKGVYKAEFDDRHRIKTMSYSYENRIFNPYTGVIEESEFHLYAEYTDGKLRVGSDWFFQLPDRDEKVKEFEVDAPEDGFFGFGGSDSPSDTALLISAIDYESSEPVEIWGYGFHSVSIEEGELSVPNGLDSLFARFTITPLENCSPATKRWWRDIRPLYDDWEPEDDVKTLIFESEAELFFPSLQKVYYEMLDLPPDLYGPNGPWIVVYVDEDGRVFRIEQPTNTRSPLSVLSNVGGKKPWWGKEK